MRKKNMSHLFDNVLWYMAYLLPLFAFLTLLWRTDGVTLATAMSSCGLDIFSQGFIYDGLTSLFGADGVMPLFASPDILAYGSYFISVFLMHLAVDVLLFIPRFAHKCMDCFGGDK